MQDAGFRVTLVGHSLGAGAAALMALMFKHASVADVTCYAFATPNCVDLTLADECSGYVTSVVFRDDIVARFSPEALALLHREVTGFDLQSALQKVSPSASGLPSLAGSLSRKRMHAPERLAPYHAATFGFAVQGAQQDGNIDRAGSQLVSCRSRQTRLFALH